MAGQSGVASIKPEYVYRGPKAAEVVAESNSADAEPAVKKPKLSKKMRGQNKNRYSANIQWLDKSKKLCPTFVDVLEDDQQPICSYQGCKQVHDVKEFLSLKPPDLGKECYVYRTFGRCPRGATCLFGSEHLTEEGRNKVQPEIMSTQLPKSLPTLSVELKNTLRKKQYNFSRAKDVVKKLCAKVQPKNGDTSANNEENEEEKKLGPSFDLEPLKAEEKKKIDWQNKLYLSPLTTLGNLPFRRICKEWGADITCSEMAMAVPLIQGSPSEWALLRRHPSEDLFGVQLCGTNPESLASCTQLVEENSEANFIDLNVGCPLEIVYQKGGGSGLLRREKQLESILRSMVLTTQLPVTIKTRIGIYDNKRVAHKLVPVFSASGVSLITIHGRTREQRYSRQADWDYIEECAQNAAPTPVFGNGDILSFEDYNRVRQSYPHIAGAMIGRGALYKPWIFREIKEQREWDISSSERLDILRKFVNYGFEHWGSDQQGVSNTRRFLLEWLSFLYRYIPIGLLERPQKINERPPRYVGRNDLETLMASPNCNDWIKISEMLCGPVPEGFNFMPKHKANSWASENVANV